MGEFEPIFGLDFWQIVMTLINTFIMYLILKRFLYEPVKKMMQERTEEVEKMYSDADEAKTIAEKQKSEYEQKISLAKKEAQTIVQSATKKANESSEEIVATAQNKANVIMKKAHSEIEREKSQAMNAMKNEISSLAILAAERVINKELKQEDHEKLIEKFIETVGDTSWHA